MTEYLAELYVPRSDAAAAARCRLRARLAAERLTRAGTPVRFVRSIFVPEDETCFLLYEAASGSAVCAATEWAALACARIAEVAETAQHTTGG